MAVAAYGAARAVGGRVSGVVSGSSDPGRVAGVLLIAGALGLLYLYEQGGLARLWKRTADAATGRTTGGIADPIGGQPHDPSAPGGVANAPSPLTPQQQAESQRLYQQHYAPGAADPLPPTLSADPGVHPLTVPPWVWARPGYATGN